MKINTMITKNKLIKENRIGKIKITDALIHALEHDEVLKIFSNLIIIKAEYYCYNKTFEYHAFSPLFKKQHELCPPPEYRMIIDSKNETITAEEIKY
jgi:hypothetical protein